MPGPSTNLASAALPTRDSPGATDPWSALRTLAAHLSAHPEDADARFAACECLTRLGLFTLALELLESLHAPMSQAAQELREQLSDSPTDRILFEERLAFAKANLAVLHARGLCPEPAVENWAALAAREECFRARDGNVVRRLQGSPPGSLAHLRHLRAQRSEARRAAQALPGERMPAGIVIEGTDPPWLIEEFFERTRGAGAEFSPRLVIVQRDAAEFLDGLSLTDLRPILSSRRVEVILGPRAAEELAALFASRLDHSLPEVVAALPGVRARLDPPPGEILRRAAASQRSEIDRLASLVHQRDADRPLARWSRRLAGTPVRVLIPGTRHATFVGRSAAELAHALAAAGHAVRLVREPDAHTLLSPLAHLRALWEFDPDLIVAINVPRSRTAGTYPPNIPYVTWIQDADPALFDAGTGRSQGPMDFIAGHMLPELFERFHFDRRRAMPSGVPASASVFHDRPVPLSHHQRFACEIAFVSHHSESPRQLHRRFVAQAGDARLAEAFEALYADIADAVARMHVRSPAPVVVDCVRRRLAEALGRPPGARAETLVIRQFALPLAERLARHEMLAWAARIVRRRAWRLHLYGRGWEHAESLAEFARGPLDDAEALRGAYQGARANLHASVHTLAHQRVLECALSGGLMLCRFLPDATAARRVAVLAALLEREPDARRPGLVGYRVDHHPETRELAAILARLAQPFGDGGLVWLSEHDAQRVRAESHARAPEQDACTVLADLPACVFRDEAELESLLERAVNDDAWRASLSRAQRAGTLRVGTYDHFAARLLNHVRQGLAAAPAHPAT